MALLQFCSLQSCLLNFYCPKLMVFKLLSPSTDNLSSTGTIGEPLGKGDGTFESAFSEENSASCRAQVLPNGHANSEYHFSILADRDSLIQLQISKTCDRLAEGLIPLPENRTGSVFGLLLILVTPAISGRRTK